MVKKAKRPGGSLDVHYDSILGDIANVIDSARRSAARSVNCIMTAAYWLIGRRIVEYEQCGKERAQYGEELLARLSVDLAARFGRGFSRRNLQDMRLFYLAYPPERIWQTLSAKSDELEKYGVALHVSADHAARPKRQTPFGEIGTAEKKQTASAELNPIVLAESFPLPWSAYVQPLSVKKEIARRFYETEALRGGWSVRQLDRQINSQFYLNYAREHWVHGAENPPVGLILCAQKDEAVARYALEGLPNKVMASEYRTALPGEKELAAEIGRTRALLQGRKRIALTSPAEVRGKKSAKRKTP